MRVDHCETAQAECDWLQQRVRSSGQAVQVLVCHYRAPAIIFGLSQRPDSTLKERLDTAGLPWMRRRAGGGTVYAGPWLLGVSLILPASHPRSALEPFAAYRWFGELWQTALASLGYASRLPDADLISVSRRRAAAAGIDWACYGAFGHGELATDESVPRKLLGIAQIRTRAASTLVAGLNLAAVDWGSLCELLGKPRGQGEQLSRLNAGVADLPVRGERTPAGLARQTVDAFVEVLARQLDGNAGDL